MKKEINIFIVSPNDVKEERNIAKEVCHFFDNLVGRGINVNAILWEYQPMSYHKNAQENIDTVLNKCDIFVVILWHRLGSVIEGYEGAITKSKNVTGTQYEIEKILANKKEAVFFYFKTKEKQFLANELEEALRQQKLLDGFLMDIELTKGSTKHGYQEFDNSEEFREKLTSHLLDEIQRLGDKKIIIPKKKNSSRLRKYMYIFVSAIMFSLYMGYSFLPEMWEPFNKIKNITATKINHKKEITSSSKGMIKKDTSIRLKNNSFIEYIKVKKYLSLNNQIIRDNSINPYYLYYKTTHPNSFNFAMSQWMDLSVMPLKFKEQFIFEKGGYSQYIDNELKIAKKRLNQISDIKGSDLANLFYAYANSEDMFAELSRKQMKKKLRRYITSSLNELYLASSQLKKINIEEKKALRVGVSNLNKYDMVFKNSAILIYKGEEYLLKRIQEPPNLDILAHQNPQNNLYKEAFVIIPKGTIKPLWFSLDTVENFCQDIKKYRLLLSTKNDVYITKEIVCD